MGLPEQEVSWEELKYIVELVPTMNLEDKVGLKEGRDVIIALDVAEITIIIIEELGITEDGS